MHGRPFSILPKALSLVYQHYVRRLSSDTDALGNVGREVLYAVYFYAPLNCMEESELR